HPLALAGIALAAACMLTACSTAASPQSTLAAQAPTPAETATATPSPQNTAQVPDRPTCDTLISPVTVADFAAVGWTAQERPFFIGETQLGDGLVCMWADFSAPAGDHLQLFGWAPLQGQDSAELQQQLIAQGWLREEAPGGVYLTEDPNRSMWTDDEGYGTTYLFTDTQIVYSDTKQGLLLIQWPPA
ncbi:hypothetical protein, partial [Mycobacterium sp.]|uniref:hypothetical protein n=1 Tax=Mycobacterium sp. TaxID=1785 RepID=UPI003A8A40D8